MKLPGILIVLCLVACSKKNPYQASLDDYFKKSSNYHPLEFKMFDTVTLQERRLDLIAPLKLAYAPGYDTSWIKIDAAYKKLIELGMADDFIIKGIRRNTDRKIKAVYDLKTLDSLESLLNGFDSKLPYRINGKYKFLTGSDTFKYYVVFDDSLKVIDAVKMH